MVGTDTSNVEYYFSNTKEMVSLDVTQSIHNLTRSSRVLRMLFLENDKFLS